MIPLLFVVIAVGLSLRERRILRERVLALWPVMDKWARHYGVQTAMVAGIVSKESKGDARAHNPAGYWGAMQISLATARGVGYSGDGQGLLNPENGIRYGTAYLAAQLKRYGGDVVLAVCSYNRGNCDAAVKTGRIPNRAYVNAVLSYYSQFSAWTVLPGESDRVVA